MTEPLEAADERRRDLEARVHEHGEAALRAVADAHRRFDRLLDGYEDAATGTGNFETYVEFQERVATLVEDLDEDLPVRASFEGAADALEQRTLRSRHFERAREELDAARELADLLRDWEAARDAYADARRSALDRRDELDARIRELEDLRRLGEADLDAPVERLREPVEAYDDAVGEAFRSFRREAPAREVLCVVEAAAAYPLVDYAAPPDRLREFLAETSAGDRSVPTLLEFADYSRSKLDHYVSTPDELKRRVATNRSYLEALDAEPLAVGWPPPPALELRWQCRECEAVLHRFAPEDVIDRLRRVRRLTREPDYDRLREAARARAALGPETRERLQSGAVAEELEEARAERDRLERALEASAAE